MLIKYLFAEVKYKKNIYFFKFILKTKFRSKTSSVVKKIYKNICDSHEK